MTIQPVASQMTATQAQLATPQQAPAAKTATTAKAQDDTVTISKRALLMNSAGYSAMEETAESPADKAAEKMKGQR